MSPSKIHLRQVKLIRFILPLVLFMIVLVYESWEHILLEGRFSVDYHFTSEILFFGILGPAAVFIVLSYIIALLEKQVVIGDRLESLNENLERKVAERTEELKERNAELARVNEELQELDQLKSDFVSLVSHELRGPLTTLNGGIELALQSADMMPPEARRVMEVMSTESQRLTNFIQTILDVSRLETGKIKLNPGPVAVLPLLQSSVDALFPNGRRAVEWVVSSEIPPVWADETYLMEAFCNLLSNAGKYSPPDTPIELSVEVVGECLDITVSDYGSGIPLEMQGKVFERFHRLENRDKITEEGWGLGLYFAKSLIEVQDGELTVKSPIRSSFEFPGTAFTCRLPLTVEVPEDD